MEKNKNELTFAAPENENQITAVENEELEFLPADMEVSVAESEKVTEPKAKKERESSIEVSENSVSEEAETAEEDPDSDEKDEHNSPAYLLKLVAVLTCICMCIALLLSVVNNITKDKIAENIANQKQEAILDIFPDGTDTEEYVTDGGETAYIVYRNGEAIGYCVNTVGSGFGGDVEVMVGLNAAGEVYGIKIVSMSETPGIGTKVQSEDFLGQFIGQKENSQADIISGATFSSNAVKEAVDRALAVEIDLTGITQRNNAAGAAGTEQ